MTTHVIDLDWVKLDNRQRESRRLRTAIIYQRCTQYMSASLKYTIRFFLMLQRTKIFLPFEFQYLASARSQYARYPLPARFYDDKGFVFNGFPNNTDPEIVYQKNGVLHAPDKTDVNKPRTRSPDSRRRPRRSRSTGAVMEGRGGRRSGGDESETLLSLGEAVAMRGRSRMVRGESIMISVWIFNGRKGSCGEMFAHVSAGGRVYIGGQMCTPEPPHRNRRFASYWNALLPPA